MKVVLPFIDDSTLIFAARMRELLCKHGFDVVMQFTPGDKYGNLSDRQMELYLPEGPDQTVPSADVTPKTFDGCAAVVACRISRELHRVVDNRSYMASKDRARFVAFQPGLEFTPERGFKNRSNFDVIFLNNLKHMNEFASRAAKGQVITWGHPYFEPPKQYRSDDGTGPVYFFAQAISPSTYAGRIHVAEVMRAIALANPNRSIVIKLRHLPGENANHVHKELYDYVSLLADLPDTPDNLSYSAEPMSEALENAAVAITCTSTAAMDAVSAGIPTFVYTDYVQYYRDRLARPMFNLFSDSGLVTPLESLLRLESRPPRTSWVRSNFRADLGEVVAKAIQGTLTQADDA